MAGNANTQTLRKFPVVTEVCAHYVKSPRFLSGDRAMSMQDWLRAEWRRAGLALRLANEACGVLNAATRKYLTADHFWYYPPVEAFVSLAEYANRLGNPQGRPYFSLDGKEPIPAEQWAKMRAKFHCEVGVTNVWREPQVAGQERIQGVRNGMKYKFRCLHGSQKPLRFIELIVRASTDEGDVVLGAVRGALSGSRRLSPPCRAYRRGGKIVPEFYSAAAERLACI